MPAREVAQLVAKAPADSGLKLVGEAGIQQDGNRLSLIDALSGDTMAVYDPEQGKV